MFMQHAEDLEKHDDRTQLWQAAVSLFADAGLTHVIYLVSNASRSQVALLTNIPDIYEDTAPCNDPFLEYCCQSYEVTWTGLAYLADYQYLPQEAQVLIRAAKQVGFVSGLGLPTRLENSDRYVGFNLGARLGRNAFEARFRPHIREIQALCFLLHRRLEELECKTSLGDAALSPREHEVMTMIAQGLSRKECAQSLSLSPNTVAEYTKSAYRKLGVRNRIEAARIFFGKTQ